MRAVRAELLAARQAAVLGVLAELLDAPDLERALDALAGALASRFGAARAAVATADRTEALAFGAIAGRASVDRGSVEVRLLLDAMGEAVARGTAVRHPAVDERLGALVAHRALAARADDTTILSVPMYHDARLVGAFLLERPDRDAFAPSTVHLLERVALAAAPVVAMRRDADRGACARLRGQTVRGLEARLGTDRPGTRLLAGVAALALAAACLVPIERHVVAEAELVPRERRLVAAPLAGHVEEIAVVAGERVEAGQLLARLDRRELELEAARRDSDIDTAEAEFRAAMASHDRKATGVARARLARERALRELVTRRLERSELRAPIAGVVVSRDPLERRGAPVARGETLFEIAPVDGYEVHLLVDEADIADVTDGQGGALALNARPGRSLAFDVRSIHPVAESADGATRFRVRAALEATTASGPSASEEPSLGAASAEAPPSAGAPGLRPGERGVARLDAGRTTLVAALLRPIGRRLSELRWRFAG